VIAAVVLAALAVTASTHRPVSTANPQAQAAFDLGLTLLYSYNGDEAYTAFGQALALDPDLAMASWGQALASGTDLNTGLDEDRFARAQAAAQKAVSLESHASPEERQFIDAVAARYAGTYDDRDADEARYRAAMAGLVATYPKDDDAAVLDAEAIMEQAGTSRMWSADGTQPIGETPLALSLISGVLARNPNNIMANHLCMHAYDYAHDRTPAIACADRVASWSFLPSQEHLAHMPAHTYIEIGAYAKALQVSEATWQLRNDWNGQRYAQHDAYTGWSAAMMLGDVHAAENWAIRAGLAYGGSDLWVTWARFDRWDQIANSSPNGQFFAPFARGLTDVHYGVMDDAHRMLGLYGNQDADFRWMLEAAIDDREGRTQSAIDALDRALAYQAQEDTAETLPLFPAGEMLGALYYRHGRYADAENAFNATLRQYPDDPRALYGLGITEERLGKAVSSKQTLKSFAEIWNEPTPPDIAQL
jgi:tetratricopeptide (TPR) repeat protein